MPFESSLTKKILSFQRTYSLYDCFLQQPANQDIEMILVWSIIFIKLIGKNVLLSLHVQFIRI